VERGTIQRAGKILENAIEKGRVGVLEAHIGIFNAFSLYSPWRTRTATVNPSILSLCSEMPHGRLSCAY
jgi:hypothetical protein